jgi:hypothetical protein
MLAPGPDMKNWGNATFARKLCRPEIVCSQSQILLSQFHLEG